jgi:hypothetical protein
MLSSCGKVLVVGSTGQIGTDLVDALVALYGPSRVITCGRQTAPKRCDVKFLYADIRDEESLDSAASDNVEVIISLAAILSATGESDPGLCWDINVNGLQNCLKVRTPPPHITISKGRETAQSSHALPIIDSRIRPDHTQDSAPRRRPCAVDDVRHHKGTPLSFSLTAKGHRRASLRLLRPKTWRGRAGASISGHHLPRRPAGGGDDGLGGGHFLLRRQGGGLLLLPQRRHQPTHDVVPQPQRR